MFRHLRLSILICAGVCLGTLSSSCSTTEEKPALTLEEQIREDNSKGDQLSSEFESKLKFKNDVEVSVFLRKIALRISQVQPELKVAPVGVYLIHEGLDPYRAYSLPGNRIYVPVAMLKKLDFENEVAALIAMELAHIQNRWVLNRQQYLIAATATDGVVQQPAFFGSQGVFAYSAKQIEQSTSVAIGLLYRSGYDPRGMISLILKQQELTGKQSGSKIDFQNQLEDARISVASLAPLRNPVVRTEAFMNLRKRIENL